ncbi:hypothetical protein EV702DRAFT_1041134, partial [Suillus placidus]
MSNSGNKKSAKQIMEEKQAEMEAELARLQVTVQQEEEEERKCLEAEKQKAIEETCQRLLERARLQKEKACEAAMAAQGSGALGMPEKSCSTCMSKKRVCVWTEAAANTRVKTCDTCRKLKDKCSGRNLAGRAMDAKFKGKKRDCGEGTPSPKGKGKRRQR